ncbi:MAG: NAD(P)-dependent oxidoreductase [Roseburia sp.]|jgi:3-hydroxyisobutyrate dehydrogenase-like beta-hydroxyacid dehydrogenase|nr:NAD(P)-dependent oxidoreductase [Roseburia sp.]
MNRKKVLLVGAGIMGTNIIQHLLSDYIVYIYYPKNKYDMPKSVQILHNIDEFPDKLDYIISFLPDDDAAFSVWKHPNVIDIIKRSSSVCIEHSTLSVQAIMKLDCLVRSVGGVFIECPVTGGSAGAVAGELIGFVGIHEDDELMNHYIKKYYRFNSIGVATKFKLLYNIWGLCYLYFFSEYVPILEEEFEKKDRDVAIEALKANGPMAAICTSQLDKIINERYGDVNFKYANMLKDMNYARNEFKMYHIPISDMIVEFCKGFLDDTNRKCDYTIVAEIHK